MVCLSGVILFTFRLYGIPAADVHCIDDKFHDLLNPINYFVNENTIYAKFLIISSSLCMDVFSLSLMIYWVLYVRNIRYLLCVSIFYFIRSI